MRWFLVLVLLGAHADRVLARSAGMIDGDKAEMGRITCGLLEKYGPSTSYHDLAIVIPDGPYGRMTLTMGPSRRLDVDVSSKRYPSELSDVERVRIQHWVIAHLPANPKPCTFLLAAQAWLDRVGYPGVPDAVAEQDYIPIQLDLAHKAATVDPSNAWRWADGALAAFRGLDAKARRTFEQDPKLRAAAYAVVDQPAPAGLSDDGKRGHCALYASVGSLFPPRDGRDRQRLDKARRTLGCR